MQHYLPHGPGPVQGQPFRLHDDLEAFVWMFYELDVRGPSARRRVVEGVLTAPKGVAKSELAGAMCCAEALGPVVFDGWDAKGDPVGREPVRGDVTVYGNDEAQAGNSYLNVAFMLDCSDEGAATEAFRDDIGIVDIGIKPESSTRCILPGDRGVIQKASARARTKEGSKDRFSVIEEPHLMTLPSTHELHETVVRTARKVGGSVLLPTNLYGPGEDSVLERLDLDREFGARDLLWFQRSADPDVIKPNVPLQSLPDKVLREQLRRAYGSCNYVDLGGLIDGIRRKSSDDAKALRFFFNMKATRTGRWKRQDMWASLRAGTDVKPIEPGDTIALGFKGGRVADGAMLVGCRLGDGLLFVVDAWEPPVGPDDNWHVPADQVEAALLDAVATYRVARAYCDPSQWRSEIESWSREVGDVDVAGSKKTTKVVAEWSIGPDKSVAEAIERFDTACLTGQVLHDGSATLERHVLRATAIENRWGLRLAAERRAESIVGAWAAVLAYEAAMDAIAVGVTFDAAPVVFAY